MENKIPFYHETYYDVQDAHFPEDIPEEIWALWYRQAADGNARPHKDSEKKPLVFALLKRPRRLFRVWPPSAKSES